MEQDDKFQVVVINNNITQHQSPSWLVLFSWGKWRWRDVFCVGCFSEGSQDKLLQKLGNEITETIIASKNGEKDKVLHEMADLWYHCLVLLAYHKITPEELLRELGGKRA